MSEQKLNRERRRRPSFFGPMLLITAGILFLANNLGVIPGDFWDVLLKMWPLILVLAGLDGIIRGDGLVWPLVLVLFGGFLTMRNFELIAFQNWDRLWRLWPLILVALGVDLILRERTPWRTIAGVIMLIVLVGASVWLVGTSGEMVNLQAVALEEPAPEELEGLNLDLSMAAGEFSLGASEQEGILLSGQLRPGPEVREYYEKDKVGYYRVKSDSPVVFPDQGDWELLLSTGVPIDLIASQGAGDMRLDLGKMVLKTLKVEQGVGRMQIILPEEMEGVCVIDQAVGKITLWIPEGAVLQLKTSRALSTLQLPPGIQGANGIYASVGHAERAPQLRISISQAVGSIEIRYQE